MSIPQFAQVYKQIQHDTAFCGIDEHGNAIRDWTKPLPILVFSGTEKLHGTNAAIGFSRDGERWFQSRERILSLDKDNAGFMNWGIENKVLINIVKRAVGDYLDDLPYDDFIVYGEWCGANIQPQVALSKMEKQFIVFGIKVRYGGEEEWMIDEDVEDCLKGILLTIFEFSNWSVEIDFNNPDEAINQMVAITNEVELKSPIGIAHDVDGIGEGVVWKCGDYIFKVKGKLHSASHVKELIAVDIEKVRSVQEFVDKVVSNNRLTQGLDYLREMAIPANNKAIGPFINWIKGDCIKEELELLEESGLVVEDVVKAISIKAKDFFIDEVLRK
jgi:hypothetical protein